MTPFTPAIFQDTFDPSEFGAQPSQRMATVLTYLSGATGRGLYCRLATQAPGSQCAACLQQGREYNVRITGIWLLAHTHACTHAHMHAFSHPLSHQMLRRGVRPSSKRRASQTETWWLLTTGPASQVNVSCFLHFGDLRCA